MLTVRFSTAATVDLDQGSFLGGKRQETEEAEDVSQRTDCCQPQKPRRKACF
jgi:hypothetical protein